VECGQTVLRAAAATGLTEAEAVVAADVLAVAVAVEAAEAVADAAVVAVPDTKSRQRSKSREFFAALCRLKQRKRGKTKYQIPRAIIYFPNQAQKSRDIAGSGGISRDFSCSRSQVMR
jgi:hypothetical protein